MVDAQNSLKSRKRKDEPQARGPAERGVKSPFPDVPACYILAIAHRWSMCLAHERRTLRPTIRSRKPS